MTASTEQATPYSWQELKVRAQRLVAALKQEGSQWIAQGLGDQLDELAFYFGSLLLADPHASRHKAALVQMLGDAGGKGVPGRKTIDTYLIAGRDRLAGMAEQQRAAELREQRRQAEASRPVGERRCEVSADLCPPALTAAEQLLAEHRGTLAWHAGGLWLFSAERGHWQALDDRAAQGLALQMLRRCYTIKRDGLESSPFGTVREQQDTVSNLATLVGPGPLERERPADVIVFDDGTYDLKRQEMVSHHPSYAATYAVDAPWLGLQDEPPPEVLRFVERAYSIEALPIIRAMVRWAIDPTVRYGEVLHLVGDSHTGKGLLLNLTLSLFPFEHTSALPHPWILDRPEAVASYVVGRRLVACPDCPPRPPRNSSPHLTGLYSLAVNEPMTARRLYATNSTTARMHARAILCSTTQLMLNDGRDGYLERVLALPTLPREGSKDPTLKASLIGDTEAHRIMRGKLDGWALAMPMAEVVAVLDRNDPAGILRETAADLAEEADPISRFADEALVPHPDGPHAEVGRLEWQAMFDTYRAWANRNNITHEGNMQRFQGQVRSILGRARCLPRSKASRPERVDLPRLDAGFAMRSGLHSMAADTLPMHLFNPGGLKRLAEVEPVDRDKAAAPSHLSMNGRRG